MAFSCLISYLTDVSSTAQGPRAQIDRTLYKRHMQHTLSTYPNLDIRSGSVLDLVFDNTRYNGESGSNQETWGTVIGVRLGKFPSKVNIRVLLLKIASRLRRGYRLLPRHPLHGHLPLWRDSHRYLPITFLRSAWPNLVILFPNA